MMVFLCRGLTLDFSQARICEIFVISGSFAMVLFAFCGKLIARALLRQVIPKDRGNVQSRCVA